MNNSALSPCRLNSRPFGQIDKQTATLWTLSNGNNMQVSIMDFGAIITSIQYPDRQGKKTECVLGFNEASDYVSPNYRAHNPHLGGLIGRHAGRISFAQAPLHQKLIHLSQNLGQHHIHGGFKGFDQQWWTYIHSHADQQQTSLTLYLHSADGEEGYTGNLHVWVCYTLNQNNEFSITISAESDQDTFFNPTQHSYFNLSAHEPFIDQHRLYLASNQILATDQHMLPDGKIITAPKILDFRQPHIIGQANIDTAFVLTQPANLQKDQAALSAVDSGIVLKVRTDAPILVVYNSAHLLHMNITNRSNLAPFAAICFEPQGYSDAPNHSNFPNNLLLAGDTFRQHIVYAFESC